MNPVAIERRTIVNDKPGYRSIYTWCPGCHNAHPFRVELYTGCPPRAGGTTEPTWTWDGNLESPTFEPSMLAHYSVHLCPADYVHHEVCTDPACPRDAHMVLSDTDDGRILGHNLPHVVDPAWGNCHSFLRAGVWEFLADSAHDLAGTSVPMVPLPDYLV